MNDQQQDNQSTENNKTNLKNDEQEDSSSLYFGDAKLQSQNEFSNDKKNDHSKEDNAVSTGKTDNLESNSGGAAGTDRAGTFERKNYGDPELNKGLESQAKDEESL